MMMQRCHPVTSERQGAWHDNLSDDDEDMLEGFACDPGVTPRAYDTRERYADFAGINESTELASYFDRTTEWQPHIADASQEHIADRALENILDGADKTRGGLSRYGDYAAQISAGVE